MKYSICELLPNSLSPNVTGTRRKRLCRHFLDPPNLTVIFLVSFLYLCGLVDGIESLSPNSKDWITSVPFKSIPTRTVQELEKWTELQGKLSQPSASTSDDEIISTKRHESHKNDPRMESFYTVGISTTPSTPIITTTLAPQEISSNPYQSLPISAPSSDTNDYSIQKGKRKKKKKRVKKEKSESFNAATAAVSSTMTNSLTPSPFKVMIQKFKEILHPYGSENVLNTTEDTGRTFFITPLLAYLFPVFLAQMFGMGMIPAAALITLPIFLLPLGIAAAVFLI